MKITKYDVKTFEETQKKHGTKTAISNILFLVADELLKDIGATRVRVSYKSKCQK
jgi:hypothetical protein